MFAISKHYIPVVSTSFTPKIHHVSGEDFRFYLIEEKIPTQEEIKSSFIAGESLIVTKDKEAAMAILALLLKPHNTTPDFIQPGVRIFGTAVIFEIPDTLECINTRSLTKEDLIGYAETSRIPLYESYGCEYYNVDMLPHPIEISTIESLKQEDIISYKHFNSSCSDLV